MTRTQEQLEFPYGAANWRVDVLVLGAPQAALRAAARMAQVLGENVAGLHQEILSDPKHGVTQGIWLPPQFFEQPESFHVSPPPCSGCEFDPEWHSAAPDVLGWLGPVLEHEDDVAVSIIMRWGPRFNEVKGSTTVVEEVWMWPPYRATVSNGSQARIVRSCSAVFGLTDLMAATLSPKGELFDCFEDGWKRMWHLESLKGVFPLEDFHPDDIPAFESWYRARCLLEAWAECPVSLEASEVRL